MAKTKKQSPKKATYSLLLRLNDKEYQAEGEDLREALGSIKPEYFKTKGILEIQKGEMKIVKLLNPYKMRRLFGEGGTTTQKILMEGVVGNLQFLLGEK